MPATLKDIARKTNISYSAVSRILNNNIHYKYAVDTVTRVKNVAEELGYCPNYLASSLRSGKRNCIGVALAGNLHAIDNSLSDINRGIGSVVEQHLNYITLIPLGTRAFNADVIKIAGNRMVDGLIVSVFSSNYQGFIDTISPVLKKHKMPYVAIQQGNLPLPGTYVGLNMEQCGYMATAHLAEQGYDSITALYCKGYIMQDSFFKGYQKAVKQFGIKERSEHVGPTRDEDEGYRFGLKEADTVKPGQAYVVYFDTFAYGMMAALKEKGIRTGENVGVVGCDNVLGNLKHASDLTVIDRKSRERGRIAAEMLFGQIDNQDTKVQQYLAEPELIVRGSSIKTRTA
jgi:LacI family transcriptional regulator